MDKILQMLKNEPYKIGHWAGLKDLTPLNNEWIKSFLYSRKDMTVLAHRGSYKTSSLAVALAIHTFTKPNDNVAFFRKTDGDVAEVIRLVKNILQAETTRYIIDRLYGKELQLARETSAEIHTNLCTAPKGASQIVGLGINASITGKHADLVVTDDIVNIKDRISHAERERTKLAYMELQNIVNRGGRFVNTGTPWHKDDAINLMRNVREYDCYTTGLISRAKLEELRKSMSDSLFAANYELKHIADADALFTSPKFINEESLIYGGVAHIDAAYGGGDHSAYTVFRKLEDGRIIGFGKRWDKHIDDCLSELAMWHERLHAGSISLERNADKGYLARDLNERGFVTNSYNENTNKFIKISTYLRKHWEDIFWLEDTDPNYIAEILDYNEHAEHDDCPDSAASLLRQMENRIEYNRVRGGL